MSPWLKGSPLKAPARFEAVRDRRGFCSIMRWSSHMNPTFRVSPKARKAASSMAAGAAAALKLISFNIK